MKRSRFFLTLMAFCVGLCLFRVKYQVMALEKSQHEISRKIIANKEAIHILKAELTHLNDPARLQKLAVTHLGYSALKPSQIVNVSELPRQTTELKIAVDPIEALMDAIGAVAPKNTTSTTQETSDAAA